VPSNLSSTGKSTDIEHLQREFPFLPDAGRGLIRGGRAAAEKALAAIDPAQYARTRNFLDGAVTRLSPYLRHGVLTLAEVRDHALANVRQPQDAEKLINELGWRDYWQRLYTVLGNGIWKDREPYKTGLPNRSYATELPAELIDGSTGLHCMDSFSKQLRETGYLHNHSRMWMAAYIVHWLHVRWQAGAKWFLQHLLDGDPASNNLSWQWVASTFSSKPYFFNRENLERYTAGKYCKNCALRQNCPLDGTYEELEQRLFPRGMQSETSHEALHLDEERKPAVRFTSIAQPLLWVHTDSLNPLGEVFLRFPNARACFVWDEGWLREESISMKRVVFIDECLAEMPPSLERRKGNVAAELLAAAQTSAADYIVAQRTPDPRLLAAAALVEKKLPILWIDPSPFADEQSYELKRFSRYWQRAKFSALRPTPKRG
jgi:deoxyribodipyrimidine photo-lyase